MEKIKREGAKYVIDFAKEIIDRTGPRLPTSPEEKEGAEMIASKMEEATGKPSVTETFICAPRASIAAIPILGLIGIISFGLYYISPIASLITTVFDFILAVLQVFTYSGKLDFLFKKGESRNVYNSVEPASGKRERTIVLAGHMDSSWNWNLSLTNPKTAIPKTVIGVVSIFALMIMSVVALAVGNISFMSIKDLAVAESYGGLEIFRIILYFLPLLCLPGCYWLSIYLTWDKKKAAPGAMDNLTGCGLAVALAKYYKENPDKAPENCRIVCMGFGSEEAGLKGSMAFCDRHKDDGFFDDRTYVLNLDSFRDADYYNVVNGDVWLGTTFDKDLTDVCFNVMDEMGLNPKVIKNPAGGCDSTPVMRLGVKTITLNAQNPTTTDYYHTIKDTVENLDEDVLATSFELLVKTVDAVAEYDEKRNAK